MRDVLLVAVALVFSLVALRRADIGVLSFVCFGLLNPHSFTWAAAHLPIAQVLAMSTIVGYLIGPLPKRIPPQRELLLLLAFWAWCALSTLFAIEADRALHKLTEVSKIWLMVVVSTLVIKTQQSLKWLILVIALSLGFYGLKGGLFSLLSGGNFIVWGPTRSFLEANNAIGLALAMNVPILYYCAQVETNKRLKLLLNLTAILSYPAVVCTFSRGAWLGLAAATFFIVINSRHKIIALAAIGVIAMGSLPFLSDRILERFDDLRNFDQESSAQSRLWNWEFCGRVALANPLHGGGFDYYSIRAYRTYFPEFLTQWPGKVWSCHSMWMSVVGEHGFPGLLLWTGLLAAFLLSLLRIRAAAKKSEEQSWLQPYADMLLGALFVFVVSGTFLDFAYFDLFYQLVAIVIILKEIMDQQTVTSPHPASKMTTHEIAISEPERAFLQNSFAVRERPRTP
jgi:probable O-glycosylation ligase (exosortase A-associated)